MVAIAGIPGLSIPGLFLVTAHISNSVLTPAVFNKWYSEIHVRDMVNNGFATIALRYASHTANSPPPDLSSPSTQYLALYNVPDVNFISAPDTMSKLPLTSDMLPTKTQPVTTWSDWTFTYWLPVQTHEGNSTATERSKYVMVDKIEPLRGGDDALDRWYREEVREEQAY